MYPSNSYVLEDNAVVCSVVYTVSPSNNAKSAKVFPFIIYPSGYCCPLEITFTSEAFTWKAPLNKAVFPVISNLSPTTVVAGMTLFPS